jgi:hypothetical protein
MLGQGYRDGCTPWGRAAYEPEWMVQLNRIGIIATIIAAWKGSLFWLVLGVGSCVFVGLCYLYLVQRCLRLGYVQPPGVISIARERDRRNCGL